MKAFIINRFGECDVFETAEVPEPVIQEDEILIKVFAGSVNPIDWKQRRGKHKFILGAPFPIILGYDVSGEIIKIGNRVTSLTIGDKVCGVLNNRYGGGLAEYAKGPMKCFAKIPDSVDLMQSAALPLAGLTALQALRDKGKIKSGHKVLIIGASGGVGSYAVQIASIYNTKITAVASSRHQSFLENLADLTFIDYTRNNVPDLKEQYDLILDAVGKYNFIQCMHLLVPGGIYINTLPRPKILFHKFVSLFTKNKKVKTLLMKHNSDELKQLLEWIDADKINICIDKVFPLQEIRKAHKYSEEGHTQGKILINYL